MAWSTALTLSLSHRPVPLRGRTSVFSCTDPPIAFVHEIRTHRPTDRTRSDSTSTRRGFVQHDRCTRTAALRVEFDRTVRSHAGFAAGARFWRRSVSRSVGPPNDMPKFFHLISQYFWIIALGFAALNYRKADRAAAAFVQSSKLPEARAHLRRFALAAALPWVIMGVGQLTGIAPTVWHYFRPQDGNVFVLVWHATVFALSCLFAWWVFMAGGAQKTVEFHLLATLGQHGSKPPPEIMIKIFAALGVVLFPVWVYLAISMDTPLPR